MSILSWYIASIPFWSISVIFFAGGIAWLFDAKGGRNHESHQRSIWPVFERSHGSYCCTLLFLSSKPAHTPDMEKAP